jgi:uncharacterized protein YjiS (DUF1127 family)
MARAWSSLRFDKLAGIRHAMLMRMAGLRMLQCTNFRKELSWDSGGIREEGVMRMFFSITRQLTARERKIATLRSMNAADLADIGLKPADVARIERELQNGRKG